MITKTININGQEFTATDLLIFAAHVLSDVADELDSEVELNTFTTLKNGRRYKSTIIVRPASEEEEL